MTKTQGFLTLMGGYHYFDDKGKPYSPVQVYMINQMARRRQIELPTDNEIRDKSKGNLITKLFVIIQSSWFILHCIARGFNSMYVTKLELLTLAYIAVGLLTWLAWWDKPQNVNRPIRVFTKFPPRPYEPSRKRGYMEKVGETILGTGDNYVILPNLQQVPIFYSGNPTDGPIFQASATAFLVGGAVAGINCIAWSYETSSFTELVLWRLSSLALLGHLLFGFMSFFLCIVFEVVFKYRFDLIDRILAHSFLISGLLYAAARIQSIILAFMELRMLPLGAYRIPYWINFVPHV